MLTVLAAAALVLPAAEQNFERDAARDVPREVLKTNVAGIWFQAFVDTNGKIMDCKVRGVLGESEVASRACDAVKGRRITPARADGKPVYGVFRGALVLADNSFKADDVLFEPDVLLEVQRLPGSAGKPVRTELTVLIDTEGRVASCQYRGGRNSAFATAACDQAKEIQMPVGKSESGEAVAYIYPLSYEFTESLASR
jgi:hypothetical protein